MVVGRSFVWQRVGSIAGLYPLDASGLPPSPLTPVVITKIGGAKSLLVENHCSHVFNELNIKML